MKERYGRKGIADLYDLASVGSFGMRYRVIRKTQEIRNYLEPHHHNDSFIVKDTKRWL